MRATLLVLLMAANALALVGCKSSPAPPPIQEALYTEPHRPQFHFSPEKMWMNDPNGMVYLDGEYHLFYQYHPDSTVWGPMHWGHAISTDLVHWAHQPIALYPDSLGTIFSGSAVVDRLNASGFQTGTTPPLVAIFTQHDARALQTGAVDYQTQGIAYSNDKGRTWTIYENNPVLPNPGIPDFRDPKVFWHDQSKQWVMVLAVEDRVQFYASPDLKAWTYLSEFGADAGNHGGVWECPDLFPMTVEGTDEQQWVLLVSINPGAPNGGSGTQYFVGHFDGQRFNSANPPETELWLDYGPDNYAGVTWSGIPEEDGRRLFIGWMSNWAYAQEVPTAPWRSAMTVPRTLDLINTPAGHRVASAPVSELQQLRGPATPISITAGAEFQDLALDGQPPFEALLLFNLDGQVGASFGLELSNAAGETFRVGYDPAAAVVFTDRTQAGPNPFSAAFAPGRHTAPYPSPRRTLTLHVLVDQSSAEVFVDGGRVVMTSTFFPTQPFNQVRLFNEGGAELKAEGTLYPLASIWQQAVSEHVEELAAE